MSKIGKRKQPDIGVTTASDEQKPFPIVALGASAGGLETLELFFKYMPAGSGMAFVIITHLDPDHTSTNLPILLQRYTKMQVVLINEGIRAMANNIYVLPPGKNASIKQGILHLVELDHNSNVMNLPIDFFLRTLAIDQGHMAIGIILSGVGSDGIVGLRMIREKGGLIIAQSGKSAQYDGMPRSAINTGLVDYVLSPEKIPEYLLKYQAHRLEKPRQLADKDKASNEIQQILTLLRNQTGHDFSFYKPNTIFRRIQRRLEVQRLKDLGLYIRYLQQHPPEIEILFNELLINVTNFFRDPEAFDALKEELINRVLKNKPKDYCVRVWVPGCATGEEAYAIAIILQECMNTLKCYFNVQIFATDIDDKAIEYAREGIYPANIVIDVLPERLNRFFIKENNVYRISNDIRKMVIFAKQNLIQDPPFTKLDLISCRNLLIYLKAQLQKKILPLFHYSLKYEGLLFLGTSETIGNTVELFAIINRRWKIFGRKGGAPSLQAVINFPPTLEIPTLTETAKMGRKMQENPPKLSQLIEKILLDDYGPPSVVINENNDIVYIHGSTSKYLEFAPGNACLNIIDMARTGLKPKLSAALHKINVNNKEIIDNGLQIKDGKEFKYINLRVRLLTENVLNRRLILVIFENLISFEQASTLKGKRSTKSEMDKKIAQLEQELKYTKDSLQTTIEELETSNEELTSSNEELQSTNEELQSTNEEIETSKEELQSLNEELSTVNVELESRIEQLSSANDDIKNLLDNTETAIIFLDKDLCIKRFTPKATDIVNLINADIGRPINHIVSSLKYEKLVEDAKTVLRTLKFCSTEVQDNRGHWYVVRIIPYRTITDIIDGVVISFLNFHAQKMLGEKLTNVVADLHAAQQLNERLLMTMREPALIINEQAKIQQANKAFYQLFKLKDDAINGHSIYKIIDGHWDTIKIKELLEYKLKQQSVIENYSFDVSLPTAKQPQRISLNAFKLANSFILLSIAST